VIVALGALHIPTEQDPPQIAGDGVRISSSIEKESLLSALRPIPPRARHDGSNQDIGAFPFIDRLPEHLQPSRPIGLLERAPLHERLVVPINQTLGCKRIALETLDPACPTVFGIVGKKRFDLFLCRDDVAQIERQPSQQ